MASDVKHAMQHSQRKFYVLSICGPSTIDKQGFRDSLIQQQDGSQKSHHGMTDVAMTKTLVRHAQPVVLVEVIPVCPS